MSVSHCFRSFILICIIAWCGCSRPGTFSENEMIALKQNAQIFPDYTGITIPVNIAPLNFKVNEDGERFEALIEGDQGKSIRLRAKKNTFIIPAAKWSKFLLANQGSQISISVYKKVESQWAEFLPIQIQVADEAIDPFVAYRLIPPGFETWSSMGLYQRDLTSFKERPIIENKYIEENCVNCHSFSMGSSENMLFHIRGSEGGTMIKKGDHIEKVDLKRDETLSAGVYPAWHPSGEYIAFSTNKIEQYFHASPEKSIEVLDRRSDLIVYNTSTQEVRHVPGTQGDQYMETYPSWSPDGNSLYFSRTAADDKTPFDSIRYDIYRIAFDPVTEEFGETEAVFLATDLAQSASFPRVSPDGLYLLCTLHDYGTFPIWHKEADLCLIDLESGQAEHPANLNSEDTDSYHSWASNSRWIVFSSRRHDGRYTKLYISYLNSQGQFQKAFLVPQKDPGFYDSFFYSYNRPELITGPVQVNPRQWIRRSRQD